jgi:hypothetical protein
MNNVCTIIQGQSPPSSTYNVNGEGLPFFQGKAEFGERYPIVVKWCSRPRKIAQKNDIFISVRAPVGPGVTSNLRRYKASVLKAAVEGKLTEEWRRKNPDVEPASELLKRILTERKKKWEEDYVKKFVGAHGHAPKDDSWKKKYASSAESVGYFWLRQLT